jgi:hypothetical protein
MLDRNVGDALLKLDLTPQTDPPTAQIELIIDSDRRRVTRWTRIAIALWVLAALGACFIFILGGLTFPLIAKMIQEQNQAMLVKEATDQEANADDNDEAARRRVLGADGPGSLENPNTPFLMLAKLTAMCMVFGTASFMILVFAGLATVLLLLRSRSATLRQINANLLQISEQLKGASPGPVQTAPASP